MTQTTLNPYLFFGGNCREAMEFYKGIFGGELMLNTFGDGPPDAHADPKANSEDVKSKIMHARLSGDIVLLASDDPNSSGTENKSQFSLSLEGSDTSKLTGYFEALSQNGQVKAPLQKQFWGDTFGMVADQFGVDWMISINAEKA
ncbi:VOC family protein [Spirosoma sp. BT702]|uniref:VOC family protein n=1 Tax=Spirosoma profusum TaxID=2771354 RepID=A0A927AVK3_9BACT|nr:VOC family protein [Spirosoma profusum]MBD2705212.1 VOC family protein [Spirosoma profusum]